MVRRGVSRAAAKPGKAPRIVFRRERAARLLGWPQTLLSAEFCRDTLTGLGCSLEETGDESWRVRPPSWRADLGREADLIEEIGRVYGLNRLPETLPPVRKELDRAGGAESRHAFMREVRAWGSGLGLNEVVCYSFTGHADLDRLRLPRAERVELLNPLSEDLNVLRTALAPGLLAAVRVNIAHGAAGVRLFEIASVFHADARAQTTVAERLRLGLVLYGARHDPAWGWGEDLADYQELRGLVEHFISFLHLSPLACTQEEHPYLSPCVAFHLNGLHLGHGGRLRPALADAYHARKEVWLAELDLDALHNARPGPNLKFAALPVYPPVRRDMTVTLPGGMSVAAVSAHVRGMNIAILEDVSLIDLFAPRDHALRNATYRLTFRHADRTLTDGEADKERAAIAASLIRGLGVTV
jgi:phenylalanyl-tRNA synthetase beta chain